MHEKMEFIDAEKHIKKGKNLVAGSISSHVRFQLKPSTQYFKIMERALNKFKDSQLPHYDIIVTGEKNLSPFTAKKPVEPSKKGKQSFA